MVTEIDVEQDQRGLDRRSFIRRSAVVGAATVWVTPTVQSMVAPAFALGTPRGGCGACLTGGGKILTDGLYQGTESVEVSVGLGQICCEGQGPLELQVTVHRGPGNSVPFHFTELLTLTCTKEAPNPAPPPGTEDCPNVFTGTATDGEGNTLIFQFEDHGEGPDDLDQASVTITNSSGTVLTASGTVVNGNLQVHEGLGPVARDCSGC